MIVVPAPKHRLDRPLGHKPWTVAVRQPPVTRRRRSRGQLMQISVAELMQPVRPQPLPRPRWRRGVSFLVEWGVRFFDFDEETR